MNPNFREMIRRNQWIVLDTETTGLNYPSEAVQIAIVDWLGETLLDTYVKPFNPIPREATRIHGITNEMVNDAPIWAQVAPTVENLLTGRDLIIYNAGYDTKILTWSSKLAGLKHDLNRAPKAIHCAMLAYAEFWGDWNDYHQSYRWQTLSGASQQQGLKVIDAHNALGDCIMTRNLIIKVIGDMARRELAEQIGADNESH